MADSLNDPHISGNRRRRHRNDRRNHDQQHNYNGRNGTAASLMTMDFPVRPSNIQWNARKTFVNIFNRILVLAICQVAWELICWNLDAEAYEFKWASTLPFRYPIGAALGVLVFDSVSTFSNGRKEVTALAHSESLYKGFCLLKVFEFLLQCRKNAAFLAAEWHQLVQFARRQCAAMVAAMETVVRILCSLATAANKTVRTVGYVLLPIWYVFSWLFSSGRSTRRAAAARDAEVVRSRQNPQQPTENQPQSMVQYNIYLVANGDNAQAQLVDQLKQTITNEQLLMLQSSQQQQVLPPPSHGNRRMQIESGNGTM